MEREWRAICMFARHHLCDATFFFTVCGCTKTQPLFFVSMAPKNEDDWRSLAEQPASGNY